MGLTVEQRDREVREVARALWTAFLTDARAAMGTEVEVIAWYRTATPFGLYPAHVLLCSGEPRTDGLISPNGRELVAQIRRIYGIPSSPTEPHPFIVRGLAKARYIDREAAFISRWRQNRQPDLLSRLAISESEGDRLLMIGYVPQPQI